VPEPYELSARYYDRIYAFKAYRDEAEAVRELVARECPNATTLLEVGCGTGGHLVFFREWFAVEGIDRSAAMLEVAGTKLAGVALHEGDMRSFDLGRRFDVVACLFSSIGYVRSVEELGTAVGTMARHLAPGGVLLVEPWFTPDQWHTPGRVRANMMVDDEDLEIARFVVSETRGRFAVTPVHHLVAESTGVSHFVETHELLLVTREEYEASFVAAGLEGVRFDGDVLPRGVWVGRAAPGSG
jgi:SAM-dependent methyltransferase